MKYENICKGKFKERLNRFVAEVEIGKRKCRAHVKNTGRCRELLIPGADVFLEDFTSDMGSRKLEYSLIGVEKKTDSGSFIVNIDSQAPNKVVRESFESGKIIPCGLKDISFIRSEYRYGASRIDFLVEDSLGAKALVEVKGVTLEKDGFARFPDAPTHRGIRHIRELMKAKEEGYFASIIFVIQMSGIKLFGPNMVTHPEFGKTLKEADEKGVEILAYDCFTAADSLEISGSVKVML